MTTDKELMKARILTEIEAIPKDAPKYKELSALADFLEENTAGLGHEVAEYINRFDTPLASVNHLFAMKLKDRWPADLFDRSKAAELCRVLNDTVRDLPAQPEDYDPKV